MTKNSLKSGIFSKNSPAAGLDLILFNYKTKLGTMVMEIIIIAINDQCSNVWKMARILKLEFTFIFINI